MKTVCTTALTVLLTGTLAWADPVTLHLGTAAPEKTPWGAAVTEFAGSVSKLTNGNVTIQPSFNSELGDEPTMARQLPRGRLDMAFLSNAAASLLVPEYGLLMTPYLFADLAEADCVFDEHLVETFEAPFEAAGVRMLAGVEIGQMVIMATRPLHRPSDIRGEKIRTAPTPTDTAFVREMGGAPVPLGNVESMSAMRTGLVVAVTTPIVMGVAGGFAAEGPEITVTRHGHQVGGLLISEEAWNRLDADGQAALREAALVMAGLRPAVRAAEAGLLAQAEADGARVHEPTAGEMEEWKAFSPAVAQAVVSGLGPGGVETWDRLMAAKASCRE